MLSSRLTCTDCASATPTLATETALVSTLLFATPGAYDGCATIAPPSARPARPLLEREAELAALEALLAAARAGDGHLVVVEAPAGMGKTRLLGEARSLAGQFEVLSARAGELEGDFAYGVVRQLFEPALATAPAEVSRELLAGAAELAAPLLVHGGDAPAAGTSSPFSILHGLYWLAANFALRRCTMLVVDDLHWADEPSLRWLDYLARRLEGLPLLVLAATRPAEQAGSPQLVDEILSDPGATVIRPGPLGDSSAASLARVLFELEPEAEFTEALRTASGGNPLYLTALLDAVAEGGIEPTAAQASHVLRLGPRAAARGIALRTSRLPAPAATLLEVAAVLGDGGQLDHAATIAGIDAETASRGVSSLICSDLLRQANPIEFFHPIVRSAV